MVVTKVEMLTKIKYKVYLDEEFAFVLYKGELSHYRIVEGTLLEEDTVQEILQKVICKRAKLRAMHLLEDMDRSESALREKLRQGLYPPEAVEAAISYVKSSDIWMTRGMRKILYRAERHPRADERFYISSARKVYQGKLRSRS